MDRERLKEVKQTDITESRVNEEFVDWLKNKAPSWLLAILLAACAYLLIVKWRQSEDAHQLEAWAAFSEAQTSGLPASFDDVAERFGDVDALGVLARLRSAQRLLRAVQTNTPFDSLPGENKPLSEEDRQAYLARADAQFERILESIADAPPLASALFAVNALNGRATVAEARGDMDAARAFYTQAAARARSHYPDLARQAEARAASVDDIAAPVTLPNAAAVSSARPPRPNLVPAIIEAPLTDLLLPRDDAGT